MKISYKWLKEYLPKDNIAFSVLESPQKLADILTSVGLEVESLEKYEEIKNELDGLIAGEVIACEKHPDADKLKVTMVNIGKEETLQIVCGAPNVAVGQKVVVAQVGTTLYPKNAASFTIKKAKIRGVESNGMLCAEDEIGIGESHAGIIVLPQNVIPGTSIKEYYQPYSDWIYEIGLTPNRMDAMSHIGVAKDVCAYLSHHYNTEIRTISAFINIFNPDTTSQKIEVSIENTEACSRYAGVSISGIHVGASPVWLQNRLKSIGVRPISNIVDITNFILHETGQPLHSFDADKIRNGKIIVKTLPAGTDFITLDEKTRKLSDEDVMICNGIEEPMCFGGVFGGIDSGVTENTRNIFLESAWFNPTFIRKTSFRHNLRTEAAIRFEKGVDIGNTVKVLQRAALLVKEICGGKISSEIIDVYPVHSIPREITLPYYYIKKISGKNYKEKAVKGILNSLNFSILNEDKNELKVAVPFSNPDITLPVDLIEEIMRIDGLDNIEIPATITMSPAVDKNIDNAALKEKIASWLTGNGFTEIFTNSITNSKYFDEKILATTVKIINSLSEDLNVLRPAMLPSGLESISYNLNRKNVDLSFFEFGKIYSTTGQGKYKETDCLTIYFTGNKNEVFWKNIPQKTDIFFVKGICDAILNLAGLREYNYTNHYHELFTDYLSVSVNNKILAEAGCIQKDVLEKFSIKQPVFYLNINWKEILNSIKENKISFTEIPKFPKVLRDLSVIINKDISFQKIENSLQSLGIKRLVDFRLFDVFESEKLGINKKSFAINFTFEDKERTLTDEETESMMNKIIYALEKVANAEIRRNN